ncbi:MAG: DUF4890 domain-containing protein [Marinilabiliaceae bacterium]|nr:DUF4890 domain-containing protein [Marinilabiliaceae bacterium]
MNTINEQTAITPESVLASVREMFALSNEMAERRNADFDREMKESRAAAERRNADFDREMKESRERFEQEMKESRERFEQEMKESRAEYEKRIKKLEVHTGTWATNHGAFAEEYFFNSFEKGQYNFFGEKFDEISKNLKNRLRGIEDEFDIVLFNHIAAAIIETKFKAHENDIPKILKKVDTFRFLFPQYKDFKIYLGLASLCFYDKLEKECIVNGIAVIKQVGEAVVINYDNLKVF